MNVKKDDYTAVKAGTPVSGSLEAYENAYYEFTSEDESTYGTKYQISLDSKSGLSISSNNTITLKKDEKHQFTIPNNNSKTAQFELTVEKVEEKSVTYDAIALNEKKTGKLAEDEKAGYELTVSEDADYSIYFNSTSAAVHQAILIRWRMRLSAVGQRHTSVSITLCLQITAGNL